MTDVANPAASDSLIADGRPAAAAPLPGSTRGIWIRFWIGITVVAVLTPLTVIDSHRALQTMFNLPANWLPPELPIRRDFDEFASLFPAEEVALISWDGCVLGSPTIREAIESLRPYTRPGPTGQPPLFTDVVGGDELVGRLTEPPIGLPNRTARVRYAGSFVGPGGKQTCVLAAFDARSLSRRREAIVTVRATVAAALGKTTDEIYLVGTPVDGATIDSEALRTVQRFALPSFAVGAVICLFCLRSWALSAVVLVIALIGQGFALAAVAWQGVPMNAILIVLPPLVFVLTASAGIHLCNYFLEAMAGERGVSGLAGDSHGQPCDPLTATRAAISAGWWPCTLAAGTTVIGLGSLILVRLWPVQTFGLVAAASVTLTLGLLLLILPGAMLWTGRRRRAAGIRDRGRSAWTRPLLAAFERFNVLVLRFPIAVVVMFLILVAVTGAGLTRLRTSVNVPRMFPPDSRLQTDYDWFGEHLGPTINGEVLVRFLAAEKSQTADTEKRVEKPGGPAGEGAPAAAIDLSDAFERFEFLRRFDQTLRQIEPVGGVISARTFLPPPPRSSRSTIGQAIVRSSIRAQVEEPGSALRQSGFLAVNEAGDELWRISYRFPFDSAIDYREALQQVERTLNPLLTQSTIRGRSVRLEYTGGVAMTTTAQDILLADLFQSFLAAFGLVAVVMVFQLRSLTGGLLAMLPNLFPTIALFGTMGLLDKPLDIGSVMTASVALGIAVDGTVHLLSQIQRQVAAGRDRAAATLSGLHHCGKAMWQTTAVCAISPLVYGLSDFIPTQRFAVMMLGLLFAALVGDVVLLPALVASPIGRVLTRARRTARQP